MYILVALLFHNGGPYNIDISPLLYKRNQYTSFYMIGTFIIKKLRPESEKILEYRIEMQTKTGSYLGSKFNLHSHK